MKYTYEVLKEAVGASISMRGVMRNLGIVKPSGGMHAHLRRRIEKFGIDTSHFKGQGHAAGRVARTRLSATEILVLLPDGSNRPHGFRLKRAMIETEIPYSCSRCHLDGEWQGFPITLHVDHINGEFLDCRRENLRFLCPNCHSQTANFAGRSHKLRRQKASRAPSDEPGLTDSTVSMPRQRRIVDERRSGDRELFAVNKGDPEKVERAIDLVEKGLLKVSEAIRQIGCSLTTFYRLRERYLRSRTLQFGSVPRPRLPRLQTQMRDRMVLECAMQDPDRGPGKVAQDVHERLPIGWPISERTTLRLLTNHGLSTQATRWSAFFSPIWVDDGPRSWAKPTLSALGSALAIACERKAEDSGIVPEGQEAMGP